MPDQGTSCGKSRIYCMLTPEFDEYNDILILVTQWGAETECQHRGTCAVVRRRLGRVGAVVVALFKDSILAWTCETPASLLRCKIETPWTIRTPSCRCTMGTERICGRAMPTLVRIPQAS